MTNEFNFKQHEVKPAESVKVTDRPLIGEINKQIGTGQNAKDSFIWMTITWSFGISTGISFIFFILAMYEIDLDIMNNIKNTWAIFTPIITLTLGYAFGKGQ